MGEKILTDEEIVKALENTRITLDELKEDDDDYEKLLLVKKITNCSLDLIRRLQYGYSSASKASEEWREKYETLKAELKKELVEHEEFTKKAKAEIERLTEEKAFYKEKSSTLSEDYESLKKDTDRLEFRLSDERVKNAELQKQVDELKGKICELVADKGNLVVKVKQTVKDTAKDIFKDLLKEFSICKSCGNADVVVREMATRKGVEVE